MTHHSCARSCGNQGVMNRRRFLATSAGSLVAGAFISNAWKSASAAKAKSDAVNGRITIRDIEVHEITEE